jgi:hypothetical protein
LFLWNIHTKRLAEGFRDKIFDTQMVATLGHALSDKSSYVISGIVKILTVAVAQGVPYCFYRILIPKISRRVSGQDI